MRAKRAPFKAPWVVTVASSVAFSGAFAGACGGTTSTNNGGGDGGNPSGCPASAPTVGGACALPTGESCSYGSSCSPTTYECNGGTWTAFHGNPPAPTCPATPPSGSCACYPANFMCSYGNQMCLGMPNPQVAICSSGQWTFQVGSCNPPPPDSGADAPAEAASDAARD